MNGTSEYSLRPARLSDAAAVFALIRENSDNLIAKPMGDIVSSVDRFMVAESGGSIVGCATYSILPEVGNSRSATVEIQSVAVAASFRGVGVGRALVEAVLARIAAFEPADVLVLTFTPEFFAKMGFSQIPKSQVMHKLYSGCIHCTKHADPFTCPEIAMSRKI